MKKILLFVALATFANLSFAQGFRGDGLGNHSARRHITMNQFNLIDISSINFYLGVLQSNATSFNFGENCHTNHSYGIGMGTSCYNNHDFGIGIGNGCCDNYSYGIGIGFNSNSNYGHGIGFGLTANNNYNYGVGFGRDASNNYNRGIGIGREANNNYNYGVGLGAHSRNNENYGTSVGAYTTSNSSSASLGAYAEATSEEALALGAGAKATAFQSIAIGAYCVNNETKTATIPDGYDFRFPEDITISSRPVGYFNYENHETTLTVVNTADVYVVAAGTVAADPINAWVQLTADPANGVFNRMTYVHDTTHKVLINVGGCVSSDANATIPHIAIYENGSLVPGAICSPYITNLNQDAPFAINAVILMETDDFIQIFVTTNDGDNLFMDHCTVTMTAAD